MHAYVACSGDGGHPDVSGGALIQLDADDTLLGQNMSKTQFGSNDFLLV